MKFSRSCQSFDSETKKETPHHSAVSHVSSVISNVICTGFSKISESFTTAVGSHHGRSDTPQTKYTPRLQVLSWFLLEHVWSVTIPVVSCFSPWSWSFSTSLGFKNLAVWDHFQLLLPLCGTTLSPKLSSISKEHVSFVPSYEDLAWHPSTPSPTSQSCMCFGLVMFGTLGRSEAGWIALPESWFPWMLLWFWGAEACGKHHCDLLGVNRTAEVTLLLLQRPNLWFTRLQASGCCG